MTISKMPTARRDLVPMVHFISRAAVIARDCPAIDSAHYYCNLYL